MGFEWKATKGIIYLNMDGTLNDFYNYPRWKDYLDREEVQPYSHSKLVCNADELITLIRTLKEYKYEVGIITWGSKNATPDFNDKIKAAKVKWLKDYCLWDEVKNNFNYLYYGVDKTLPFGKYANAPIALIDDELEVRVRFYNKMVNNMRPSAISKKIVYNPEYYGVLKCLYEILEDVMEEAETMG